MSRGVRIAFVAGLSDKKLAQKLAPLQALDEVEAIDLYRRRPFSGPKIHWAGIPQALAGIAPLAEIWRVLSLLLNAREYDGIVGCHQRFHGIYAALAGALLKRPVIQLTITDPLWIEATPLGRWSLRRAAAVGFRGSTTLEDYRRRNGGRQLLFVIHNYWRPVQAVQLDRDKRIDLLYVGYHQAYKQLDVWLRVAAAVKSKRGGLHAAWVGDLPGRSLRRRIGRLGLRDDLLLLGELRGHDLHLCYARSRVLLLTSRWEGLPMAALEAMAAGVPVVATDTGDTAALVRNGETGFLTPTDDVECAALAVTRLLCDHKLAMNVGHRARALAQSYAQRSTLDSTAAGWRSVLRSVGCI